MPKHVTLLHDSLAPALFAVDSKGNLEEASGSDVIDGRAESFPFAR